MHRLQRNQTSNKKPQKTPLKSSKNRQNLTFKFDVLSVWRVGFYLVE
ncbi:hypothetical protein CAMRE0001_0283 [Campylobacter rectus RM3267]|uniref:Uncharacterized protein n=1 Tax=Campylobacter rectus RM3267 TaxID=553218 RepID=B9CY79_CAMRE|nr:hypothetical protein CAMRE0001_0283 [Campylobacter rectus RM3267]